ncbi:hypothetical protein LXA43DRAFT_1038901 [Ganoderma leucocontextum]|nr:hypothetical protein LXA43DRAFT_1038901 [Ganoderma leucocontextum]
MSSTSRTPSPSPAFSLIQSDTSIESGQGHTQDSQNVALVELVSTVHTSSFLLVHNDITTLNPTAAYAGRSIFSAVQANAEAVKTLDRHMTTELDSIVDKVGSIGENVDSIGAKVDNLGQDVDSLRQDVDNHLGQNIDNLPGQNVGSIGQLLDSFNQRLAAVTAKIESTGHKLDARHCEDRTVALVPHQDVLATPLPSESRGLYSIERELQAQNDILQAQQEEIDRKLELILSRLGTGSGRSNHLRASGQI